MEPYIKNVCDITFMSELTPTSVLKFSKKILAHLTSRGQVIMCIPCVWFAYGKPNPKNLYDIFGIRFGINSQTP